MPYRLVGTLYCSSQERSGPQIITGELLEMCNSTKGENIGGEGKRIPVPKSPMLNGQWRKSQLASTACILGVTEGKDRLHWTSFPFLVNGRKIASIWQKRISEKMEFNTV